MHPIQQAYSAYVRACKAAGQLPLTFIRYVQQRG